MPWRPQLGFQSLALSTKLFVDELFMGGDRGGGKSSTLLADYAQDVKIGDKWKGIIFRKTADEFETLIERSKEMFYDMFGKKAVYLQDAMTWKFPGGATLQFHHMHRDGDADKFVGREYVWIGWDELPQFPSPKPYLKLLASVRTSGKNIPSRVRSTGNPGGAGIGWVKQRFQIDERRVEECDGQLITDPRTGLTRMFLLSLYKENKIHQHLDPNYRNRLLAATEGDPELERAWVHADFSALFGQYFKLFDDTIHKVDPQEILHPYGGKIPAHWRLEAGLDYGDGASPTSFILYATTPENISYAIAEYYDFGEYPSFHASACEALYRGCPYTRGRKPSRVWADTQIFYTRTAANQGQMNKRVSDVFRREAGLNVVPSNKDRMAGWRHVKELIAWRKDGDGKFIRTPQFYYFPECVNLEREFKDAVHSETGNRHDIDKGCSDHALDQLRYWAMGARKATQLDTEEKRKAIAEKSSDTFAGMMRQNKMAKMGMAHHYAPFVDLEKTPADIDRQLLEMLEEQSEPELVA